MNLEQDYLKQERAIAKSFRRHSEKLGARISDDDAIRELFRMGIAERFHDRYLKLHNIKDLRTHN